MDQLDIDNAIKHEFIQEAIDLIDELEINLIALEKSPSAYEAMETLVHITHTIKGSGYAAGFDDFSSLAHVLEELLQLVKSKEASFDKDVSDALFDGVDKLKESVQDLNHSFAAVCDFGEAKKRIVKEIKRFSSDSKNEAASVESVTSTKIFSKLPNSPGLQGKLASKQEDTNAQSQKDQSYALPEKPTIVQDAHIERLECISVLLCDDEPDVRTILKEILEIEFGERIFVRESSNGLDGLEKIREKAPDLVITDLKMPEMNGLTFIKKAKLIAKDLPFIMISGHAEREHVVELIHIGVFDFIDKPFDSDLICLSVKNAVKMAKIKSAIMDLANLNFSTYLSMQKLLAERKSNIKHKSEIEQQVKKKLDTIAVFTNKLLSI